MSSHVSQATRRCRSSPCRPASRPPAIRRQRKRRPSRRDGGVPDDGRDRRHVVAQTLQWRLARPAFSLRSPLSPSLAYLAMRAVAVSIRLASCAQRLPADWAPRIRLADRSGNYYPADGPGGVDGREGKDQSVRRPGHHRDRGLWTCPGSRGWVKLCSWWLTLIRLVGFLKIVS